MMIIEDIPIQEKQLIALLTPPSEEGQCEDRRDGWICTRTKDHDGAHVAHGAATDPLAYWTES
jgi:hypothetical protein